MTKASEIRPVQQQPNLQQKEADKTQKQAQQKKVSQNDEMRIAQQAGFVAQQKKKKTGKRFDVGPEPQNPIGLPDELEVEEWSNESLEGAQQSLGMASAQLEEVAKSEEAADIGGTTVASSFLPTEDGLADLEELAKRPAPEPLPMDEVTTNVERLFAIKLDKEVPVGHKVLATGLVVAGESGAVDVGDGGLDEKKLADGVQKVTKRGNQSVGEAQKMNKGIDRELNVQRTFVFKR